MVLSVVMLLIVILALLSFDHWTENSTLSEVMSKTLSSINWNNCDSLSKVKYGIMFGKYNLSTLDVAIRGYTQNEDWLRVIRTARLAEINGYWSNDVSHCVMQALGNISMHNGLPLTPRFENGQRFMMNAFRYSEMLNYATYKYNATEAYETFKGIYDQAGCPFLYCDSTGYGMKGVCRWYDEGAQTMDVFLRFYELGNSDALTYANSVWTWINENMWNESHYAYLCSSNGDVIDGGWECVTSFHLLVLRLRYYMNNMTFFNNSLCDVQNRLLEKQFSSPQWLDYCIRHHNPSNDEHRLTSTLDAYAVLHAFYPLLNSGDRQNFVSMLNDAWKFLCGSSGLYDSAQNKFRFSVGEYCSTSSKSLSDDASCSGLATLFLLGIIPDTGSLAIPVFEESAEDQLSLFNDYFSYNDTNHSIRVPIRAGRLGFKYGTDLVNGDFSADGTYEIKFSSDWNKIEKINFTGSLNLSLIYA